MQPAAELHSQNNNNLAETQNTIYLVNGNSSIAEKLTSAFAEMPNQTNHVCMPASPCVDPFNRAFICCTTAVI